MKCIHLKIYGQVFHLQTTETEAKHLTEAACRHRTRLGAIDRAKDALRDSDQVIRDASLVYVLAEDFEPAAT
ncbi:hypothetical protein [Bradyrhizobium sp.]